MAEHTGISWTDSTWNPVRGCSRVSDGCRFCYAEEIAARFSGPGQPYEGLARRRSNGEPQWTGVVQVIEQHLTDPLRWKRPRRIFVNSMSDLFHERLSDVQIDRVFAVMAAAPQHVYQVLTKRPQRMRDYLSDADKRHCLTSMACSAAAGRPMPRADDGMIPWPLPQLWLGVSVEDQQRADERVPILLQTPAAVRWISAEPLLGPLHLWTELRSVYGEDGDRPRLDWVVCGGESGPHRREMKLEWLTGIVEQCRAAGVACYVKQDSALRPGQQGKIPDDVWAVKQFPEVRA